jgi:poly-gamma-glutamate synthesis protein (capsule biosynthesis protein)
MKQIIISFVLFFISSLTSFEFIGSRNAGSINYADSLIIIKITCVGDLMCHTDEFKYAHVEADSFNFLPYFHFVRNYFDESDFLIGNLETVLAGSQKKYSGYPFFNSPDDFAEGFKLLGFDMLWTSNNHSLDKGETGILRTIQVLKQLNINYSGTFESQNDRDSIRIYNIKGIRVGVLSYSYGTNGNLIPAGKEFLINIIDTARIKIDIAKLKELKPDVTLVYFHFGEEYQKKINEYQLEIVKTAINSGAEIILGSHPHVLQGVDYFSTVNTKFDTGFVAYSLGNFISNQQWRFSDAGVILNITLQKNIFTSEIRINQVEVIPTWVYKGEVDGRNQYMVLPSSNYSDSSLVFLSNLSRKKMAEAYSDSKEILNSISKNIICK